MNAQDFIARTKMSEMVRTVLFCILLILIGVNILQSEKLRKILGRIKAKIKEFNESDKQDDRLHSYLYDSLAHTWTIRELEEGVKKVGELDSGEKYTQPIPEWHAEGKKPKWVILWFSFIIIMGVIVFTALIWGFMHSAVV